MQHVVETCFRLGSGALRVVGTFLIGVGLVASLPVLALGWLAFYVLPNRSIRPSGASPTLPETSGSGAKHTGAPSTRRYDEATLERLNRSSGSSSGRPADDRTSISSLLDSSIRLGFLAHGHESVGRLGKPTIWLPERASSASNSENRRPSPTPASTLSRPNRRNCRPCSWIRALVGGGVSPAAASAGPRVPQSRPSSGPSNQSNGPGITFSTSWNGSLPPNGAALSTRSGEGVGGASMKRPNVFSRER